MEETTTTTNHYLVKEPVYLSPLELVFSSGFRFYMACLWIPTLIIVILTLKLLKKLR